MTRPTSRTRSRWLPRHPKSIAFATILLAGGAIAAVIPLTLEDFHIAGTQIGMVTPNEIFTSDGCFGCHSHFSQVTEPYDSWSGSLMGQAGRDPLFWAQMATANQDAANAGYYCMRCHVPMTWATGTAYDPSGASVNAIDQDGVNCHFCHSMVDPIYKPGISPAEDEAILAALGEDKPNHYGNAMFVLDPQGRRRSGRANHVAPHEMITSPFHRTGDFCGTCHEVGNLAVSKQPDGTYRYNAINQPTPDEDPWTQFPLERTYSEWKLSAFANGGVDMGGRFGGLGASVVSSCQDCHMPRAQGQVCSFGPVRNDAVTHEFAGASSWVLEIIKEHYQNDPNVNPQAMDRGILAAKDMLSRAATLEGAQSASRVNIRVTNESGHKIPTGHIEGRRIFLSLAVRDSAGAIIHEYGHYDFDTAELDEASTVIYEMHVGLSDFAAGLTGFPAGVTTHMALADTIEKDSRIPPRGFNNAAYEAAGAPAVAWEYADGQHWDDSCFRLPAGAASVDVKLYYQTVTKHYIEALRDYNTTNEWGNILHDLWLKTNKGAPVLMAERVVPVNSFIVGDADGDGVVGFSDLNAVLSQFGSNGRCLNADFDLDGDVDFGDLNQVLSNYGMSADNRN